MVGTSWRLRPPEKIQRKFSTAMSACPHISCTSLATMLPGSRRKRSSGCSNLWVRGNTGRPLRASLTYSRFASESKICWRQLALSHQLASLQISWMNPNSILQKTFSAQRPPSKRCCERIEKVPLELGVWAHSICDVCDLELADFTKMFCRRMGEAFKGQNLGRDPLVAQTDSNLRRRASRNILVGISMPSSGDS